MGVITHPGSVNAVGKHVQLVRSLLKEDSDVTWNYRNHSSCELQGLEQQVKDKLDSTECRADLTN